MSYLDYNIETAELQEILRENVQKITERKKFKDDLAPKLQKILTVEQYQDFCECGDVLAIGENYRVIGGNFCRNRLCPVCNRRNSAQKWAKMYNIATQAKTEMKICFALLTLTVKNVTAEHLAAEISHLMKSIDRLHKRTIFKENVIGYFRSLEITYNTEKNTFHPHYHYILALPAEYKQHAVSTYDWRTTWEKCARLDYTSQIDIRLIDDENIAHSVAEVAKYAVKLTSVIEQDTETLNALIRAIKGRRLISYGGAFKEYSKENDAQREQYDMENGYEILVYDHEKEKYERSGIDED